MKRLSVVTGATSGIGYEVMVELLNHDVDVIAVGRNMNKLNEIEKRFEDKIKSKELILVRGDLSDNQGSMDISKNIIDLIQARDGKLDLLINVAGIVKSGYEENKDHNELTFATNHLSVYILTGLLYPFLKKSKDPRVLVVSSLSHYRACFDKTNLQSKRFYNVLRGYQRSKLYNVMFVYRFSRFEKDIKIYAIDPGLVKTDIGDKHTNTIANFVWRMRRKSGVDVDIPAKHMVDIAILDRYLMDHGSYMKLGKKTKSSRITYHTDKQDFLWKESEKLTHITYPFDEVSIEES